MTRARVLLQQARVRPWHVGMAAFVAGLIAGPRAPIAVPLIALAAPVLARHAGVRVVVVVAVLAGAVVAQARLAAVDATHLTARLGHAVNGRVVLLETPRSRAFGTRVATAGYAGERVLLRAGRGVRWNDAAHTSPVVREEYDFGHVAVERAWSVAYANTSQNPTANTRVLQFEISDASKSSISNQSATPFPYGRDEGSPILP